MSNSATKPSTHYDNPSTAQWLSRFLAVRIAAIVAMCGAATVFAHQCVSQLHELESGSLSNLSTLAISIVAFVASLLIVLFVEVCNMTRRFRAAEQQVRVAMQRIRAGDVGFRVARRPGEPMARLVQECNGLLAWLNHNPPSGVNVDRDLFDLDADDEDELA